MGSVFDVFVDVSSDPVELRCWNDYVPIFVYDKTVSFHSMFVPTADTCRYATASNQVVIYCVILWLACSSYSERSQILSWAEHLHCVVACSTRFNQSFGINVCALLQVLPCDGHLPERGQVGDVHR